MATAYTVATSMKVLKNSLHNHHVTQCASETDPGSNGCNHWPEASSSDVMMQHAACDKELSSHTSQMLGPC